MPRPLKIVQLGLEDVVRQARLDGKNIDDAVNDCNQTLLDRGQDDTSVSSSAANRYWASLPAHVVPAAHEPQRAAENATLAISILPRLEMLDGLLQQWLTEAAAAGKPVWGVLWDPVANKPVNNDENAHVECVELYTADWHARGTMAREMREFLKVVADLMERVYDADQVAAFQQAVMDAIREADPNTALHVTQLLQERRTRRAAAILGQAA